MQETLVQIEAQADALRQALSQFVSRVGAASASQMGAAARKRTGSGEAFWQYRPQTPEDSASRIDWRKSGRGDEYFVRDAEMETPRSYLFWTDPSAGFRWSSGAVHSSKFARALSLQLALAKIISKSGDKVGALVGNKSAKLGLKAPLQMAEQLYAQKDAHADMSPARQTASYVIASDFYGEWAVIENTLGQLARKDNTGAVLMVSDPIEVDFPFEGRVEFNDPDMDIKFLVGRAEELKHAYQERFEKRKHQLMELTHSLGWSFHFHCTSEDGVPALADMGFFLQGDRFR